MFDTARAKLGRARKHLDQLRRDIAEYVAPGNAYTVRQERHPDTGHRVLHTTFRDVDPEWPLVIGDCLHNLRSALDHVVNELSGGMPHTEFPIFKDRREFFKLESPSHTMGPKTGALYKLRGVSDRAWCAIESAQPYVAEENGLDPETEPLWILHQLNNIDKHRTLHLCREEIENFTVQGKNVFGTMMTFSSGEERTVAPDGGHGEMDVNVSFTLYVAFDEGEVRAVIGRPVEAVLNELCGTVGALIDRLESVVSV